MSFSDLPTVAPTSCCINPRCANRFNAYSDRVCQSCGTPLIIHGRYRLLKPLRPLDPAYLTEIFEVEDQEEIGVLKVLKILAQANPKLVELLQREAEVLGRLEHPGIPHVSPEGYFTVLLGEENIELHCLVLEKVEGQNLRRWVEAKGPIDVAQAFQWLEQLADILALVHHQQFLHRDIKPSNIMRRSDGQLVLIDFGTVREMTATYVDKESSGDVTRVYSSGFTAPEQIQGSPVPQSDYFSLGMTFAYLLSGQYPSQLPKQPDSGQIDWSTTFASAPPALTQLLARLTASHVDQRPRNDRQLQQLIQRSHRLYRHQQRLQQWVQSSIWQRWPEWLMGLGLLAAASVIVLLGQRVYRQSQMMLANQLITQAETLQRERQLQLSALLAIEAIQRLEESDMPTLLAKQTLRQTLTQLPLPEATFRHPQDVNTVTFSPNGQWMATASLDGLVQVWDVAHHRAIARLNHKGSVHTLAFSADSQYLATAGADQTVQIWQVPTQTRVGTLTHSSPIMAIAFNPTEATLATATADGMVQVWNVEESELIQQREYSDFLTAIAFSPDGRWLAASSSQGSTRLWSTIGDRTLNFTQAGAIHDLAFSPDSQRLATTSAAGNVQIWSLTTGESVQQLEQPYPITQVAFSPNGEFLAIASGPPLPLVEGYRVQVWAITMAEEQLVAQMNHTGAITHLAFSPNGEYLATASYDHTARIWDVAEGRLMAQMTHDNHVLSVAWHPTSDKIATASADNTARVWQLMGSRTQFTLAHDMPVTAIAYHPDGSSLATVSDRKAYLWNPDTGELKAELLHANRIHHMTFSPDGEYLATVSQDHAVHLWSLSRQEKLLELQLADAINDLQFSPNGEYIATAIADGSARVWEVVSGLQVARLPHDSFVEAIDFSATGRYLATASLDNTARIWEWQMTTPREVARLQHDSFVETVLFSPNDRYIATASLDNTARLWDLHRGMREVTQIHHATDVQTLAFSPTGHYLVTTSGERLLQVFQSEQVQVWRVPRGQAFFQIPQQRLGIGIVFSPDGHYLASISQDGTLHVWDLNQRQEVARRIAAANIQRATFSPDGQTIAIANDAGMVNLWRWSAADQVGQACALLTRNLTPQEWSYYLGDRPYRPTCPEKSTTRRVR